MNWRNESPLSFKGNPFDWFITMADKWTKLDKIRVQWNLYKGVNIAPNNESILNGI